jgi:hypothetical protein
MSTTSGSTSFNLDLVNLIEEAYERCGQEMKTGYDMRTARRSLNIMTIEWANRGINLWTIEQGFITIETGQACYPIPVDTIDLLDTVTRTGNGTPQQSDINITRISESTYMTIPNKLAQGRPIQVWINRQSGQSNVTPAALNGSITATDTTITVTNISDLTTNGFVLVDNETIYYQSVDGNQLINCARGQNGTTAASHSTGAILTAQNLPSINVYPTGDGGGPYIFAYYRLRRIQDSGTSGQVYQDIPFRFIPCMVAGLAFYLSQKIPQAMNVRDFLKSEYEEQWFLASTEDRDKASDRYVPRNLFYA